MSLSLQAALQILTTLATVVAATVIFIAWKQLRADHERGRRQLAVELIRYWATQLNQRASVTRKLIETLDFSQAKRLSDQKSFKVAREQSELLKAAVPPETGWQLPETGDSIDVPQHVAALLRWESITYLNKLESILVAWHHNIADRELIMEQFRYLVAPTEGHAILAQFREAAGGNNFPAIAAFVEEVQKNQTVSPGKSRVA